MSRPPANSSIDSSTGEAPDESSRHWLPQSAPDVNNSQVISPEHTSPNNYIERRGASDISYTYRPTPIDVESQQQRPFLPTSPPSINNNTFPLVTSHTTDSFQGLAPIEEDEMPHDPSGKFTLNPTAPVFVPRQRGQPSMLPLYLRASWDRV